MPRESHKRPQLELWAGVECTVNRVGDRFHDQLELNGHAARISDLEMFAALGIRAMRYPVLWERTAPDGLKSADWSWADERLATLRSLGIRPIIGLVHHGSGPRETSLIDPEFPEKLASYARAVALRYPWVEAYTPVNEPLTTARFSGLYGHWYPHGRDEQTFLRALFMQCRGIVLATRAIREVNPRAQFIQTEDMGKVFSTPALSYQAEFENERRWLSLDLLMGRVNDEHPLWNYLCWVMGTEKPLEWFLENNCAPDIIGINHYLTSERFLDERLERYPLHTHGGNGRHAYADVEAVRVCAEGLAGPQAILREAWQRYQLPLAVTEVHLGCTREEQMRWLKEVWDGAQALREDGADVRAVTAWSLLGAYDWHNLLTRADGRYEPGVYDLRGSVPRATALARLLSDLSQGREHEHPLLSAPGWWRRLDRLIYPPARRSLQKNRNSMEKVKKSRGASRPILITGARGTLGRAFARLCELRGISYRLLSREEMDIADAASVEAALTEFEPWGLVNAAGYVRVDDAEREREKCLRENFRGPLTLAQKCAEREVMLLSFSSDLVFDGAKNSPYVESDQVAPLNVYGRSKAQAEAAILEHHPSALVIRTSAFFGPWDEYNFLIAALRTLANEGEFIAADDAIISPTYVPDLVNASLDLLIDAERGVWHLANEDGALTWFDLAQRIAEMAGLDSHLISGRATHTLNLAAPRPLYSTLSSERGALMPSFEDALQRYLRDCEVKWQSDLDQDSGLALAGSSCLNR